MGHILETSDPERKEEIWTVTSGISWVKGKDNLLTFYKMRAIGRWAERCLMNMRK